MTSARAAMPASAPPTKMVERTNKVGGTRKRMVGAKSLAECGIQGGLVGYPFIIAAGAVKNPQSLPSFSLQPGTYEQIYERTSVCLAKVGPVCHRDRQ